MRIGKDVTSVHELIFAKEGWETGRRVDRKRDRKNGRDRNSKNESDMNKQRSDGEETD